MQKGNGPVVFSGKTSVAFAVLYLARALMRHFSRGGKRCSSTRVQYGRRTRPPTERHFLSAAIICCCVTQTRENCKVAFRAC